MFGKYIILGGMMSILLSILVIVGIWTIATPVLFVILLLAGYGLDQAYQDKPPRKIIYVYWLSIFALIISVYIVLPIMVFA